MQRQSVDTRLNGLNWDKLEELIQTDKLYGYREFCRLLDLQIMSSGSGSQLRQLNELSLICEYEKINSKYRFIRMRNEDEIMLYKERSIYTPLIEYCLSEKFLELQHQNDINFQDGILYFSMSTLMSWCGIVHENYQFLRQGYNKFEKKTAVCLKHGFDMQELSKFLTISYDKVLKPMIRTALKSMDNKKSIVIHKGFKIYVHTDDKTIYKNILATSETGRQLEDIIANVYTEFGIKKIQELFFISVDKRNEIYDRCNELCKQKLGYDGFYDCYAIVINEYRTRYNLKYLRKELNERVQRKLLDTKILNEINYSSREDFITTMVALDSKANFEADLEEYYKYKLITE